MAIDRIMVTIDGSKASEGVLPHAHRLLKGERGRITILQVVSNLGPRSDYSAVEGAADRLEAMGGHPDMIIQPYLKQGSNPAQVIAEEASLHRPEVLAMATHGRSGLTRLMLGSTTESVVRSVDIPILVCNQHSSRMGSGADAYTRILIPLDGSDVADLTLPFISKLAVHHGAEVILLRIDSEPLQEGTRRFSSIAGYLDHYATALEGAGVKKVEIMGRSGEVAPSILETVESRRVDLVAMGTHGRKGLERIREGSVTEQVLRECPCPMIIQRPPAS